ncbi:MAG: hypothetical protein ACREAM_30535 [Blastocatellia bacterium]
MKRKTIFYAMVIWALLLSSVWAADLNGKWIGQVQDKGSEPREISFDFKVAGAKLTGTVAGALNGPILNGRVNGDELSFSLSVGKEGAKRTINFKGQMANGEINFTATREGGEGGSLEFSAKRAAK